MNFKTQLLILAKAEESSHVITRMKLECGNDDSIMATSAILIRMHFREVQSKEVPQDRIRAKEEVGACVWFIRTSLQAYL